MKSIRLIVTTRVKNATHFGEIFVSRVSPHYFIVSSALLKGAPSELSTFPLDNIRSYTKVSSHPMAYAVAKEERLRLRGHEQNDDLTLCMGGNVKRNDAEIRNAYVFVPYTVRVDSRPRLLLALGEACLRSRPYLAKLTFSSSAAQKV